MLFCSLVFIYVFLPLVLCGFFLIKIEYRKNYLIACSLVFVSWASISYLPVIILSAAVNYLLGKQTGKDPKSSGSKRYLIAGIIFNVFILCVFKYASFLTENINQLTGLAGIKTIHLPEILLPLGVSFYTFRSIAYLIDVYRGQLRPSVNFSDYFLYILYFPVLAAGPIIKYQPFEESLRNPGSNRSQFSDGITRFIIGLARKVLIANQLSIVVGRVFEIPLNELSSFYAWMGMIFYTLQIYHDFGSYSDMAIGLCKMLGFNCPENFNFPLSARSVKDFWNKWHITLSNWLRDYLFLPRAYASSRRMKKDKYLGIKTEQIIYAETTLITFLICGIWHGARWTYAAWGLYQAFFLISERALYGKSLAKLWKPLQHIYALIVIVSGFVLFRAESFTEAAEIFRVLFSFRSVTTCYILNLYILNPEIIIVTILAIAGSSGVFKVISKYLNEKYISWMPWVQSFTGSFAGIIALIFYVGIFFISTLYMLANTYNAFIYFKF